MQMARMACRVCVCYIFNGTAPPTTHCCSAGRDGREAHCFLFYSYSDAQRMRHMLTQSAQENGTPREQLSANMDSLNCMVSVACVCRMKHAAGRCVLL